MGIVDMRNGVVSGMILGDSHLNLRQKRIEFCHTLPQLNYLKFKLNLMEQLGFNCRIFRLTKKRTTLGVFDYCSGTATGANINDYYQYRLVDFLRELNPLGMLIWWLDDGCLSVHHKESGSISRFGYLNTQGYNLIENQAIQKALFEKFGIETTLHIDSQSGITGLNYWRIYLNATNMRRLIDLVREFIPWCPRDMYYKFNMNYVINRRHDSLEMATHYNF